MIHGRRQKFSELIRNETSHTVIRNPGPVFQNSVFQLETIEIGKREVKNPPTFASARKIRKKYQNEVYFDNSLGKKSYWFPMSRSREINGPKTNKMPTIAHIFIRNQTVQSMETARRESDKY